jgi:hypothetical protein
MICAPYTTSSAASRISASSQQIHGSHSAPFRTRCSIDRSRPCASFAAVGNPAPPSPTIPARRMRSINVAGWSEAGSTQGSHCGSRSSVPSLSMTIIGPRSTAAASGAIVRTRPVTGACRSAPVSLRACPIGVPSRTRSRSRTQGSAARPSPWSSATQASSGAGVGAMGRCIGVRLCALRSSPPVDGCRAAMFSGAATAAPARPRPVSTGAARCNPPGRARCRARIRCTAQQSRCA